MQPLGCPNICAKLILNSNLAKSRSPRTYFWIFISFWKFAHRTTEIMSCSVQNFKAIWQISNKLWVNEIWRELSLMCVCWIVSKFCTEHDSGTVVLCAKFQNDSTIGKCVMWKRNFVRIGFHLHFKRISHIAQGGLAPIFNSLRPTDAYLRHQPMSSLVQIMACHLFGTKPLSQPILYYCQLDPKEQTSVKLHSKFRHFHSRKCIWKCRLGNVFLFSRPQCVKTVQI